MGTNDHLAFVKVEGPWNDEMSVRVEESNGFKDKDQNSDLDRSLGSLNDRIDLLKQKIDLYFKWYHVANISAILQQTANPAQLAILANATYDSDSECLKWRLLGEMNGFSAGLSRREYRKYDKSALMCLHMNPGGVELSTEGDDKRGWWLPLNQNFIAWRAMGYQQPLSKFLLTTGLTSMTIDFGNLNVVFKGTQMWRSDVEGLEFNNMKLDIAPPNTLPDMRPEPPAQAEQAVAAILQAQFNALPNDYDLPWQPQNKICHPKKHLKPRFEQLKNACGFPLNPTDNCRAAFATFYPCFNLLLRPSKSNGIYDHGMDTMIEFTIILHVMSEAPPSFWEALAIDKPWDSEFKQAVKILGLAKR